MRLTWVIAPALILLLSCSSPTMICACPPATFDAVVYGRVTTPEGAPVAGAPVYVENQERGCQSEVREWERGFSHPSGAYRVYFRLTMSRSAESCLVARAEPPAGSMLLPSVAVPFEVRFGTNQPVDSVQVDLVLRAP